MNYHRAVIRAIEHIEEQYVAPEAQQYAASASELLSTPNSVYASLRDAHDRDTVIFTGKSDRMPNAIYAKKPTSRDFGALVRAYADVMGGTIEDEAVYHMYEHERQHLSAYTALGAKACRIGVSLHLLPKIGGTGLTPSLQPFSVGGKLKTTKLGVATIIGNPEELSASDINDLNAMGYDGADDVAERIAFQPDELTYPQPRSSSLRNI